VKTAVFIPVRTTSTRLPGKVLLDVNGKPVIEYLIERVKSASRPDLVVICTTVNPGDKVLVPVAKKNDIGIFQGSETDILDRYLQAAHKFSVDFIVVAEGDDIFCDPEYIDRVVEVFQQTNADYISCEGLPLGIAPCGIKVKALEKVCRLKTGNDTATGWKNYFTENDFLRVEAIQAEKAVNHPEFRMTLDYPEDFELFKAVITRLYTPGKIFSLHDIVDLLVQHPEIAGLNDNRKEEYWANFAKNKSKIVWRQ
jgi:spore coat polysaccharide biosynthesis protein SpsF